jgi:hypothetical protein
MSIEASDEELRDGLPKDTLLKRINEYEPNVRMSDLSAALNRIDALQDKRDISPLVLTFSGQKISLVDRELLFYRRYGQPVWPWNDEEPRELAEPKPVPQLPAPRDAQKPPDEDK